jgi:polar amino acid transport system substrate-binding protein
VTYAALALMLATPTLAQEPLKSALDGNAPPYAMPRMDGTIEGWSVDMTAEIAKRIGRPIDLKAMSFSALVPALQAGTFDMLSVPFGVTQERSQAFLLTEGIWSSPSVFLQTAASTPITNLMELKGKRIATNAGNYDDKWARENIEKYGWTVESYGSLNDAAQAVQANRADVALVGLATGATIRKRNPALGLSELRLDRGTYLTYAIPLKSPELRMTLENAIECIKSDGTAAALYKKWLGEEPPADALETTPQPGYGPVGFANYEPAPHELSCK